MNSKLNLPVGVALFAALAVGLMFLLSGGLLQAQDADGPIPYAENDTGAVATFTGSDPEGRIVYWSLPSMPPSPLPTVDGAALVDGDFEDNGDFSISADGVLSFKFSPDYEMPRDSVLDTDNTNTYKVVVVASDNAPGAGTLPDNPIMMGYKKVVITVTDVDEPGVVTLSSLQPQVGVDLTATLVDPEVPSPTATDNDLTWKWEKSQDKSSWEPIDGAGTDNTYGPDASTEDYYLRATATYDDDDGNERTFAAVSVNRVRAAPDTTDADAVFPAADANARSVDENSPADTKVGKPVAASDTADEVLTYSLTGTNADSFRIDPQTGQITVGPLTVLDHEATPTYPNVTVSVIGAGGGTAVTQPVTITVNDVNEAPMMTGGVTMMELPEYDADTEASGAETEDTRATTVSTYIALDPEGEADTLTWSLKGADMDKLMIGSDGALTFKEAPNYEMPADAGRDNVYNVTVVATDNGTGKGNKMTAERMVVIMVTNVEENGTVELSAQQPKIGVAVTARVTDPDGTLTGVSWKWERDEDRADDVDNIQADEELIKGAESATYTPTADDNGKFLRAIATYMDGKGRDTSMVTSTAMVEMRIDNPPEFSETEDGKRSIEEGMSGDVVEPVRAMDAETTQLLTYSLSGTDSNSFEITSDTAIINDEDRGGQISVASGVKLDYETKNSYMVTVTATDPDNLSASIAVTIKVTNIDEEPMITGDAEKDYQENGTRMVARYTADDPEDRMVYWSVLPSDSPSLDVDEDGTDDIVSTDAADADHFMISAGGVLTFNIPPDHEVAGDAGGNNVYNVVVVASDNAPGAGTLPDNPIMMGYKKVVITVTDVDEPGVVTLSSLQPQVGVALMATLAAPEQHEDTPAITWKWEKSRSRSSGWSAIDGAGSTDTYEPNGEIGYLRATATYRDSDNEERTVPAVSVNKVRAAPDSGEETAVFPDAANANDRSVDENSPADTKVGKPVAASDTADEVLTYSLTGTNADSFRIDPQTGQITVGPLTMLDHEATPSYSVTVSVIEARGGTPGEQEVTITVNDVNEAPMMTGGVTMMELSEYDADTEASDEGAEVLRAKTVSTYIALDPEEDTPTWSLKGADMDKLMIGSGGALTFKEAPNYEMPADAGKDNVYNVTVVATDIGTGKGNKMTAERMVVIMVTNEEEDGTVELSAQQPKIGIAVTARVTDPDGTLTGVSWKWERDEDRADDVDNIQADEELIKGAESATYTPTADDTGKFLRAIATYMDGKGRDTSMVTSTAMVVVRMDNPPEFSETEDGERSIEEGMSGDVVEPVRAMDAETTQLLTYSLSGTDSNSFEITSDTATSDDEDRGGQISVASGVKLDYETKKSYMVTVTATDPDNLSASIDVTITVTNVDEEPVIMLGGLRISGMSMAYYEENRMDAVETYMANGPMAATARWSSLQGDDAGNFRLSRDGVLTFRNSPNYENPTDMGMDNMYMVTIMASDGTYTDTHGVMVMVTNVNELGTLAGDDEPTYAEDRTDAVGTYMLSGGTMDEMAEWMVSGDDADAFTIPGGVLTFNSQPDFEDPMGGADNDSNTYMVTVMASAGGEMDTQDVMVTVTNVDEMDTEVGDTLLDRYDDNKNGQIDRPEVLAAIRDFVFNQTIERDDVVDVIRLFLFER